MFYYNMVIPIYEQVIDLIQINIVLNLSKFDVILPTHARARVTAFCRTIIILGVFEKYFAIV